MKSPAALCVAHQQDNQLLEVGQVLRVGETARKEVLMTIITSLECLTGVRATA